MTVTKTPLVLLTAGALTLITGVSIIKGLSSILLAGAARTQPITMNAPAPELVGGAWLNTPNGASIALAARRGKVTIVQFWTFSCYNCLNNLPSYARWHRQFAGRDVALIGIHTPETAKERVAANVIRRVKELAIEYPILMDQQHTNWDRWDQRFWPTVYLIDKQGRLRYRWEGELEYNKAGGEATMAALVEKLLAEP